MQVCGCVKGAQHRGSAAYQAIIVKATANKEYAIGNMQGAIVTNYTTNITNTNTNTKTKTKCSLTPNQVRTARLTPFRALNSPEGSVSARKGYLPLFA